MDDKSFAAPVGTSTAGASRRGLLGLVSGAIAALSSGETAAKKDKRPRRKEKRSRVNAFGCLNVGQHCRGKDTTCCSGICAGKRPQKGKKDRARCVAHNTGGCLASEQSCGPSPDVPCGGEGFCLQTTGNAGFCGRIDQGACAACRRDADCQNSFGDGAACVVCANGACPQTGDRACVPAAA